MEVHKPVNDKLLRLIPQVGVALVLGSEGSGKSNLAYGILESLRDTGRKLVVHGFPIEKAHHLPDYITICPSMDFPEEAIVLADEAYIKWHSRESMSGGNKFMDTFSGLVRQKDILAIYITQFSRKLDIGLVSAPRVMLIKEPSLLQVRMDRSALRPIISDAAEAFRALQNKPAPSSFRKLVAEMEARQAHRGVLGLDTEVSPRSIISTYVFSTRFEGMIDGSNVSPSFWSEHLSKAWKGVSLAEEPLPFFGKRDLCVELDCREVAIGVCSCCGNSYCETHAIGHTMMSRR